MPNRPTMADRLMYALRTLLPTPLYTFLAPLEGSPRRRTAVSPPVKPEHTVESPPVDASLPASVAEEKWDARLSHAVPHDRSYYTKCMAGGALACGLTHTVLTPLDVTKCNMQVEPDKYRGLLAGIAVLVAEQGYGALWKGWLPTLLGYSFQGMFKFGLYEYFKDWYSTLAGKENSSRFKGLIFVLASASAEFFADIALCPMEMVKVKVQTSTPGTWPVDFASALLKMGAESADTRFPFGAIVPLWSRQIPYTIVKFYLFEKAVAFFYNRVFTKARESYSKRQQLGITFLAGYTAGIGSALVSNPADSLISQLGKATNEGKSIAAIAAEVGFFGLLTGGLATRILMIGTLTGLQWWIYDTVKTATGLGTSGGK